MLLKSFDQADSSIEMTANGNTFDIKAKIGSFVESFSFEDYKAADTTFDALVAEAQQLQLKMELH